MIATAVDVDVPEPSPLFWDHLSARVRDAVAAEKRPRRSFWSWPRLAIPLGAVAMAGLAVALTLNSGRVAPPVPVLPAPVTAVAAVDLLSDPQTTGDTALTLVAELTSDMDFDAVREAGLALRGSAEHAITHLDGAELRELRRLLQEELAHSGA